MKIRRIASRKWEVKRRLAALPINARLVYYVSTQATKVAK